jgi:hypothetical protein
VELVAGIACARYPVVAATPATRAAAVQFDARLLRFCMNRPFYAMRRAGAAGASRLPGR